MTDARQAIVVDIVRATTSQRDRYHDDVVVEARSVRVIFGPPIQDAGIICTFSHGRAHHRGNMMVEPRPAGSGIEFSLSAGERVIFLVARETAQGTGCKLLRVDRLDQEAFIASRRH
ncbi:hypothetical protein BH10PSE17_BH10PSE17_08310 [soil metagenome]